MRVHVCQFYGSRRFQSFLLGRTQMYESSHHRNVFLSLSPQPTHLHLLRDTQTWVFISPSLRMKDVCKLLQMLILQWRKDLTDFIPNNPSRISLIIIIICFLPCGCNIVQFSWFQSLSFHHICSILAICHNQKVILSGIQVQKTFSFSSKEANYADIVTLVTPCGCLWPDGIQMEKIGHCIHKQLTAWLI